MKTYSYNYTYDGHYNISAVTMGNLGSIRYYYDDLDQLLREDNELLGKTYVYTYDYGGNITSKKTYALTAANVAPVNLISTQSYSYTDDWGDLLTAYNGVALTYDEIGNPLTYYNGASYTFEWLGRRLVSATTGSNSLSFTYNDDSGIRTSKTKNGVTTTYYLDGSLIIAEETSGNVTVYLYDASGSPAGMQYHASSYAEDDWDIFWYEKNLQGDIVAVYNEAGTKLVSYTYDAWGSFSRNYHNGGSSTVAGNNPFLYRGYYYDKDLQLYYLNARYYDPAVGRFINADSALYHSILGYNMYAYCRNNPVNFVDYSGESPETIATFFGWLWAIAVAEPTPAGEIVAGVITAGGAIVIGVAVYLGVEVGKLIDETSQSNKKDEVLIAPPQSITEPKEETETSTPTINEAKESKAKGTKEGGKYQGKKVAPRIKSNSKKAARQKAFLKGGKRPPIHHPNGKYGPHFHPNNPKFSHWHYYYIIVFTVGQLEQER